MFQTIVIVILLGIIGYLILDKKNIKLDDLKAFLKDGGAKLKASFASEGESGSPHPEMADRSSFSAADGGNVPAPVVQGGSYFDGGLLQQIGWTILGFLVTFITLGICYPWSFTMLYGWETKHTVINGRRLRFDGTAMQLFGNWIKWLALSVITLGIYGFWVPIKLKKWKVKHTSFIEPSYPASKDSEVAESQSDYI